MGPIGWHIPSIGEWISLIDFLKLNGYGYQGSGDDVAKSIAATSGWVTSIFAGDVGYDLASNNSTGFTAMPSGWRYYIGQFLTFGHGTEWWSSTEYDPNRAFVAGLDYAYEKIAYGDIGDAKKSGDSARCIQDLP